MRERSHGSCAARPKRRAVLRLPPALARALPTPASPAEQAMPALRLIQALPALPVIIAIVVLAALAAAIAGPRHAAAAAAIQWSPTRPPVNETHIFEGGVNRRGKPVGFHSRPGGRDPQHARVVRILRPPNRYGVYEAQVEIDRSYGGGAVSKRSTFYPDSLDRAAVVSAILAAYAHRQPGGDDERFRGPSGLGFTIEGYLLDDGSINTAYPIY